MTKTIDFTLQGKGGVGKSYVSSLLAQYYMKQGHIPVCIDTDPVNATFASYKAFKAERLKLGEKADEINPRNFDQLIEQIIEAPDDTIFVIDNGAATFLPLVGYMAKNDIIPMLQESGCRVNIHSILTGGQAFSDTLEGLNYLLTTFPTPNIFIWQNEYFGKVEKNGKSFETSDLYQAHKTNIQGLLTIPELEPNTFGYDLARMLKDKKTFEEAIKGTDYTIMPRQRLTQIWRSLSTAMEQARL